MKKIIPFAMLIAAAAMTFSSCSKDSVEKNNTEPAVSDLTVFHISAPAIETKTVFGAKEAGSYPTLWTVNKKALFSANDTKTAVKVTPTLVSGGTSATFETVFAELADEGTIYAFSPEGDYDSTPKIPGFTGFVTSGDAIYLSIPSEQTPLENSVDESAQAIVASQSYVKSNPQISMSFSHVVAYGKMKITNFSGTIKSVKLQFPVNVVGQSCKYSYKNGTLASMSGSSITLDASKVSDNTFWFALAPTDGNTGVLKITITDNNDDEYSRVLDLSAKNLPFTMGHVSSFTVNFNGVVKDTDYVTLPWNWAGGIKSDLSAINGVTLNISSTDYTESYAPYRIKLEKTGDNFIIKTDSPIAALSVGVKMAGGSTTSSLVISGSADGQTFTDIQTLEISGNKDDVLNLSTTNDFEPSYRYVKASFQKGSNVGLGPIGITKGEENPSCKTPVISYNTPDVSITCATNGARIYYTLDGTTPTSGSTEYISTFALSESKTVKAIAVKPDYLDSEVASQYCVYSVPATITCDPESLNLTKASANGKISAVYTNAADYDVKVYKDNQHTELAAENFWLTAAFDASHNIDWTASANDGQERKAYIVITVHNSEAAATIKEIVATQAAGSYIWTYSVSDKSTVFNSENPVTINEATWNIVMGDIVGSPSANGSVSSYSSVKAWKWGDSGSKYWKSYTLSTSYFDTKKVKKVTVNFLNNGSKSATMTVTQGTTTIGTHTKTFGTTWTDLTADTTQGTGGTLSIQYSVAQASFIHSITVEYLD